MTSKEKNAMLRRSTPMSLKISLLTVAVLAPFVAVLLLCTGLRPFVSAPIHVAQTHHMTTLPSQFSALSPELNAAIEAKVKGRNELSRIIYPAVQIPGDAWMKLHASTASAPMIRSVVMI
jgi:hypothetical protein